MRDECVRSWDDVPRMKIRTPVRWYSLSPALNLGLDDVKVRACRHCDERGMRRVEDCGCIWDGLIVAFVDWQLIELYFVVHG